MKIAATADWHTDNMRRTYLIDGIPNRELDMDRQVELMHDECVRQGVEYLFIAGDLFERSKVSGYYIAKAVDYIRLFSDSGIRVVVLDGNHDKTESGDSVMLALGKLRDEGVKVISAISKFTLSNKVSVLLIPHERREQFVDYATFTDYVKDCCKIFRGNDFFVIGHFQPPGVVPGSEVDMFSGSTRYLDPSIFGDRLVICGHVHKPQLHGNVYIPGSIVRFNSDETDDKRFLIVDIQREQKKVKWEVQSISLQCQPIRKIKIDMVTKTTCFFAESKVRKLGNAMLCVEVITSKENRALVSKRDIVGGLEKGDARVISFKVITRQGERQKEQSTDVRMTPLAILKRVIKREIKDKDNRKSLYELGKALLEEV